MRSPASSTRIANDLRDQQVAPRGQSVRAAPAVSRQRSAPDQGRPAAQAAGGRGGGKSPPEADRGLVRRGDRRVEVVTGTGHWYKAGDGLVPIRWVFVHDRGGTHRDEYFYTTDPRMRTSTIVTRYAGRWNLECIFQ